MTPDPAEGNRQNHILFNCTFQGEGKGGAELVLDAWTTCFSKGPSVWLFIKDVLWNSRWNSDPLQLHIHTHLPDRVRRGRLWVPYRLRILLFGELVHPCAPLHRTGIKSYLTDSVLKCDQTVSINHRHHAIMRTFLLLLSLFRSAIAPTVR